MIEALIFDVDGTLTDSVEVHAKAWLWAFARHGHDIPLDDLKMQIGKGADQLLPVFLTEEQIEQYGKQLEEDRQTFFKDEYYHHIKAFPQVRELFERIKADGKRIVLASSAKKDELEHYEKLTNVADLIDGSTSSDDSEKSKPHPDIFHAAIKILKGVDVANMLVVGDTPWDAQAASSAGLRTVGLLCGGFKAEILEEAGCIALYETPADLLARYDESPLAR